MLMGYRRNFYSGRIIAEFHKLKLENGHVDQLNGHKMYGGEADIIVRAREIVKAYLSRV